MRRAKSIETSATDPPSGPMQSKRHAGNGNKPAVPTFMTVRISRDRKALSLEARGAAALVLAGAFGVGLLAWAIAMLVKVVE